ncbi:LLM class flavin-dependent oxidoreductase [Lampropedia puyangensis]|uniref:LLM class flavin-dependent oxidoreductase n=1 Tax=Lampropedia puyangensis TaxID=1330072 RepID=A0A4S8EW90_9BURK|nr:LLM class flavin-dependent oxidoreductase [Lampropedia puyangensis]THT98084.1 LLM class flavin-dependent oxidoreductase [Lampropedia puyangensis]
MSTVRPPIKLGLFLYRSGHHIAAWLDPRSNINATSNFAHYAQLTQLAERACFDLVFFADSLAVRFGADADADSRIATRSTLLEPLSVLPALAAITSHIGLVATATTTYNHPFHLARRLATIDHISQGRVGWNLVTSNNEAEAANFGLKDHPRHAERYARAGEFVEVLKGLWDSWDDDAVLRNRDTGIYFDPQKVHPLHHDGEHFQVRGPLNVERSPQGYPVLVQAGASDDGRHLAARHSEVVFTAHSTLANAQAFYADLKNRAAALGRDPHSLIIMPGLSFTVAPSRAQAEDKAAALNAHLSPEVGLSLLSAMAGGVDLHSYPIDGPLPELPLTNAGQGRQHLVIDMARREGLSIRQLYERIAAGRGHASVVGTPAEVADHIEEWHQSQAADGFNILPPALPGDFADFVELVIPELRRRGLFRSAYEANTLRGHLGLSRPAPGQHHRHATAAGHAAP